MFDRSEWRGASAVTDVVVGVAEVLCQRRPTWWSPGWERAGSMSADRSAPAHTVGGDFDALAFGYFVAEAELVVLAFEASERDSVVDLPAVDLPAIHRKTLGAWRVFPDELLVIQHRVLGVARVRRMCERVGAREQQHEGVRNRTGPPVTRPHPGFDNRNEGFSNFQARGSAR